MTGDAPERSHLPSTWQRHAFAAEILSVCEIGLFPCDAEVLLDLTVQEIRDQVGRVLGIEI